MERFVICLNASEYLYLEQYYPSGVFGTTTNHLVKRYETREEAQKVLAAYRLTFPQYPCPQAAILTEREARKEASQYYFGGSRWLYV